MFPTSLCRVPDYSGRMAQDTSALRYRFSRDEFVRAWEAAAFDHRVALIEGEVWPVAIGDWHGATVGRIIPRLWCGGTEVTTSTRQHKNRCRTRTAGYGVRVPNQQAVLAASSRPGTLPTSSW
jgi:hypothetical protein